MPVRRKRRSISTRVHHLPAEWFPQRISHRRKNDFRHLGTRRAYRLPRQLHSLLVILLAFPLHSSLLPRAMLDSAGGTRIIRDDPMTDQKKTPRQMLQELVAEKPDDAFSRYGLA